ncbi:hypothetical protein PENCOP_c008G04305 [Penicillium coprophilum]|uniref:C2H2-type domain-containing protein n=1 Tax=Penicillium coprophilum TaxID=36646 RepID=A0A1V6UJI6_9EURO|nr:hypothetical protein PENCOP_c008G04305 [Penicillium coprophilum]
MARKSSGTNKPAHKPVQRTCYHCPECPDRRFKTEQGFNDHVKFVHGIFSCPKCDKLFAAAGDLACHRRDAGHNKPGLALKEHSTFQPASLAETSNSSPVRSPVRLEQISAQTRPSTGQHGQASTLNSRDPSVESCRESPNQYLQAGEDTVPSERQAFRPGPEGPPPRFRGLPPPHPSLPPRPQFVPQPQPQAHVFKSQRWAAQAQAHFFQPQHHFVAPQYLVLYAQPPFAQPHPHLVGYQAEIQRAHAQTYQGQAQMIQTPLQAAQSPVEVRQAPSHIYETHPRVHRAPVQAYQPFYQPNQAWFQVRQPPAQNPQSPGQPPAQSPAQERRLPENHSASPESPGNHSYPPVQPSDQAEQTFQPPTHLPAKDATTAEANAPTTTAASSTNDAPSSPTIQPPASAPNFSLAYGEMEHRWTNLEEPEQNLLHKYILGRCHSTARLRCQGYEGAKFSDTTSCLKRGEPHQIHNFARLSTNRRKAIVLNCETIKPAKTSPKLAFITAVDFLTGEVLINSYVKPSGKVTSWPTPVGGITKEDVDAAIADGKAFTSNSDARKALKSFMDCDTVLIGHGLHHAMRTLDLLHGRIVDTALVTGEAAFLNFAAKHELPRVWGLEQLAREILDIEIQKGPSGQNSLVDALAAREILIWCLRGPECLRAWAEKARIQFEVAQQEKKKNKKKKKKRAASAADSGEKADAGGAAANQGQGK